MPEAKTLLRQELETYARHKPELLARHEGKFVLIIADRILGVFEDRQSASNAGYQQCMDAPFLVHQVLPMDQKVDMPLISVE
ncbi:hypothetical protein KDL44_14315 [bacterium]|nr:hypothetical protein [bacterium]